MSEKKGTTKSTPEKAVKKTVSKKTATKKKIASPKKSTAKKIHQSDSNAANIKSIIEEMNAQRTSRDKQISSLIDEIRTGFNTISSSTNKQDEARQKEMTDLYQSLQGAFGQINETRSDSETLNLNIFKSLSDSMKTEHEQTLYGLHEQEKLQDKKIVHISKLLEQRTGRNRLIAIPGMIFAVIGIVYMFYVVTIMESAMTNMSVNMHLIQKDVGNMSGNMSTMSSSTESIDNNMNKLNGNMGQVSKDLNVMTRNVTPAMKGMSDMMPWTL